ncbi:MAG: hypothetical protein LQ352_006190 [Teloschistes flavicans]|nr:MAG: hypothetical protein LQ352_006190 [Teloschistes flavicans]
MHFANNVPQALGPPNHPTAPLPPPPRRLFRRILIYTSLSLTSLTLGIYLATTNPLFQTIPSLFLNRSFPAASPAHLPPTERAQKINELMTSHPLSESLRSDPEWTESRPYSQMPEIMRSHSLTANTLLGDTKIPVAPLIFTKGKGEELIAISYLGSDLCGHVGIVHGGMLATMLDEGLARCCFAALPGKVGVTARLEVDFRKAARSEGFVVLKARTVGVEGRKAWVVGRVEVLPMSDREEKGKGGGQSPWDERGEVLVEAKGLYVEPKWAKVRLHPSADLGRRDCEIF